MASWRPPWRSRRPLGAVLGRSWGLLEQLGSHLEASWAILSHLGGHFGLCEALLEPSWAILDAPTRRRAPRPGPGEGVGGGVKLASSSESSMACPFPPALPQHKKQCWHNWGPKSHRPAGLAQLMRPRWRLPMGTPALVSKAARAFQYESRMPQEAPGSFRWPQEAPGCFSTPQGAPGGPRRPGRPGASPGGLRKP